MSQKEKELQAKIDELQAKLAAKNGEGKITYKVSAKGAVSAYGLNARFPVTLYAGQWERLDAPDEIKARAAFIKDNAGKLSRK